MTTSGVYTEPLEIADFVDEAFERCGIDPVGLTSGHLVSARRSINLMFADWGNKGVHLFAVDEQTQTLTDGTAGYTAATGTLAVLECFVRRSSTDTPVHRISREDYARIPNKTAEGLPTRLYFDRKLGTYTLWQTPENSTDVLHYWRLRRLQTVVTAAETPDVPYLWTEALVAGLAERLSIKFAVDRWKLLSNLSLEAFKAAKTEDRERGDVVMEPA